MSREMTRYGVGPRLTALSAAWSAAALALRYIWPVYFRIDLIPWPALVAAGAVPIILSIVIYEAAVGPMKRAFTEGRLVTRGAFRLCRNPIYLSLMLGIAGVMLLARSAAGIGVVAAVWIALRLMVRTEERWLEEKFGDEYRDYRRRTPAVLPGGWPAAAAVVIVAILFAAAWVDGVLSAG